MIRFQCECGRALQAREQDVGKQAKCPACGAVQAIPAETEAVTPSAPAPPRRDRYTEDDDRDRRPRGRGRDDRDDDRDDDRRRGGRRRDREPEQVSGKAMAAMILGVGAFCLNLLAGAPAIVLAVLALRDIERSGGRLGGRGAAIGGMVCGGLGILFSGLVAALLIPAYQRVNEARDRVTETNNLKQVSLALHSYHDVTGHLPQPAAFRTRDGKPGLSWRVALLPYLEQQSLFRQFRLDEPWDSPNNIRLVGQMPKVYQQPGNETSDGTTYYQAFVGPATAFEDATKRPDGPRGWRFTDFTDGTSNTILIAVAERPVPWTAPQDMAYDPAGPLPRLSKRFRAGAVVAFTDGAVRPLPHDTPEQTLRGLITRNGGEVIAGGW